MDSARPAELTHHRLPIRFLEALASGAGSPEITRFLWETERSRRLLLVVTLFKHCEIPDVLGPLGSAASAWAILSEARDTDRAAVDDLLLHPQIGNAAAYTLRRWRGGADSDLPSWVDLGLVQILALVAAARVGLTWSATVPARYGTVMLPTLGLARFPYTAPASTVEAHTEAGSIYLSAGGQEIVVGTDPTHDTDRWWHLRHLHVGRKPSLTIWFDDVDPFRDLADPEPPKRLDDAAFTRWRSLLDDAWALLCRHHVDAAEALAEGVVSLVPLPARPGQETRSASNGEAFGSVLVSEPPDAVTLAVSLVHEFQHIKLGALMHLLSLAGDDDGSLYYAPWRDDPRPLSGFLQGIYAFFGIADFWRRHRLTLSGADAHLAGYEYLYARGQTAEALNSVRDAPALTETGRELVRRLGSVVDSWSDDPVDPEVARLARLTADCHRTAWRLRHRRFAVDEAGVLAKAWLSRSQPIAPSEPLVGAAPAERWPQLIPTIARRRILGTVNAVAPGDSLAAADLALVHGDTGVAQNTYRVRLAGSAGGGDDEIRAWVGLALALADGGAGPAARALLHRPDVVRAVRTEARALAGHAVDPVEIAQWLAPALDAR